MLPNDFYIYFQFLLEFCHLISEVFFKIYDWCYCFIFWIIFLCLLTYFQIVIRVLILLWVYISGHYLEGNFSATHSLFSYGNFVWDLTLKLFCCSFLFKFSFSELLVVIQDTFSNFRAPSSVFCLFAECSQCGKLFSETFWFCSRLSFLSGPFFPFFSFYTCPI